eukprot:5046876-Pleurochrysis_carterae.AAC.1
MQIGRLCMRAMKRGARQQLRKLYGAQGSKRGYNAKEWSEVPMGYGTPLNITITTVGHRQAVAAKYAVGGIHGMSPATGSEASDWQLCVRGAGCRACEGHDLFGAPRHIMT